MRGDLPEGAHSDRCQKVPVPTRGLRSRHSTRKTSPRRKPAFCAANKDPNPSCETRRAAIARHQIPMPGPWQLNPHPALRFDKTSTRQAATLVPVQRNPLGWTLSATIWKPCSLVPSNRPGIMSGMFHCGSRCFLRGGGPSKGGRTRLAPLSAGSFGGFPSPGAGSTGRSCASIPLCPAATG